MKKTLVVFFAAIILVYPVFAQQHPRLFFSPADIAGLKSRANREPYTTILREIRKAYRFNDTLTDDYNQSYTAALAGFLYLLTDSNYYAQVAKQKVTIRINDVSDTAGWARTTVKGLTTYNIGTLCSYAYDFCYHSPSWDSAGFRAWVSTALLNEAKCIIDNGGTQQNTNTASNWQGIRGSAGGICLLATDDVYANHYLNRTIEKVVRYYVDNYGDVFTSCGWNIEGLGYTYYPFGNFIGPFTIAIKRLIPTCDFREIAGCRNTYWSIYSSFITAMDLRDFGGMHPDWGDDNPHPSGEGSFAQAFYFVSDSMLSSIKYWFDRTMAVRKVNPYDNYRMGAMWSYLCYIDTLTDRNPMTDNLWQSFSIETGGNGYMTYRNQYKDSNDLIAQMYIKLRGNKGHNGPDALSYRIAGEGTAWAVGGGRYGVTVDSNDVYKCSMNTLYPFNMDTRKVITNGNSGILAGFPYSCKDGSGHVISTIVQNNVGVINQKRWFVADYDSLATGAKAVYIIGDESDNGYYWQLCTYLRNSISTSLNTFTITSKDSVTMRGTILYPLSDYRYTVGKRRRGSSFGDTDSNGFVHFRSDDGDYLVVLTIARKGMAHPSVSATGTGIINNTVQIGTKTYTLTDDDVLYSGLPAEKGPRASFFANRTSGPAPLTVTFDASNSLDPEGLSLNYSWNFGDGVSDTGKIVTHTYSVEGDFKPVLVVTDQAGNKDLQTGFLTTYTTSGFANLTPFSALLTPKNNSTANQHDSLLMTCFAEDADGYVQKVEFYDSISGTGNTLRGVDSTYPFSFTWYDIPSGTRYMYIKTYDNLMAMTKSSKNKVTVNVVTQTPSVFASVQDEDISVFPVPSDGRFYVAIPGCSNAQIDVFDVTGTMVLQYRADNDLSYLALDNPVKGIYLVRVIHNGHIVIKRMIVR